MRITNRGNKYKNAEVDVVDVDEVDKIVNGDSSIVDTGINDDAGILLSPTPAPASMMTTSLKKK